MDDESKTPAEPPLEDRRRVWEPPHVVSFAASSLTTTDDDAAPSKS